MTFPYPNRVQWAILWGAAITYLIVSDLNFLPALGGYDCDGHWMWPGGPDIEPADSGYLLPPVALAILEARLASLPDPPAAWLRRPLRWMDYRRGCSAASPCRIVYAFSPMPLTESQSGGHGGILRGV